MTRLLAVAKVVWSVVRGNWLTWFLLACVWGAIATAAVQTYRLQVEQARHRGTQAALSEESAARLQALAEIARWREAVALARQSEAALVGQVQAAHAREAHAVRAARQRDAILSVAKARPITESEIMEVVDNATRQRVADYLNRHLP